jgi:hypothetical protein
MGTIDDGQQTTDNFPESLIFNRGKATLTVKIAISKVAKLVLFFWLITFFYQNSTFNLAYCLLGSRRAYAGL